MRNIKHYGIAGMRWGVRKAGGTRRTVPVGRGPIGVAKELAGLYKDAVKDDINKVTSIPSKVKSAISKFADKQKGSSDHEEAKTLKTNPVKKLSNKEIQKVLTRVNLEKQFNSLDKQEIKNGKGIVGKLLFNFGAQFVSSFFKQRYSSDDGSASSQTIDLKFLEDKG